MRKPSFRTSVTGLSFSILMLAAPAFASVAPFDPDSPWLLGDWAGYRKHLADEGVDF